MNRTPRSRERWGWLDGLEAFTRFTNHIFSALSCLLVLVITALIVVAVFYRYVLDDPIAWVLDITIFLLVFVFFLAVAPALESGSHIEVDLFDPLIPPAWRRPVRILGKLLTLAFAVIFFWFVSAFYYEIVEIDELSFTMITVQLKLIYWIGPIGAFQFLLTAIVQFIRFCREPLPIDDEASAGVH
jgi:TRAP-type C4-dicarboxylate transport system permease small subunit